MRRCSSRRRRYLLPVRHPKMTMMIRMAMTRRRSPTQGFICRLRRRIMRHFSCCSSISITATMIIMDRQQHQQQLRQFHLRLLITSIRSRWGTNTVEQQITMDQTIRLVNQQQPTTTCTWVDVVVHEDPTTTTTTPTTRDE
jgi:hypothetical protein